MAEIFVGRRDELARFAALLMELTTAEVARSVKWRRRRHSGGDLAGGTKSRLALVYGLGGSGKSRLLRQFQRMAQGELPDSPIAAGRVRTVWLDWEDEQRDAPGSYAGMAGPSLVTVLDSVQEAVIAAIGGDARAAERAGQAFGDYRRGAARMPEYAARFANVVAQSRQAGSPFTAKDATALGNAATSAGLLAVGHPGGVLGLTPSQLAAAAQAGVHLSEAAAQAVTGKKPGEISPQEYDLVTDPARELTRRSAAAIRSVAGQGLLAVFLDTGEVIGDRAWGWLRRVMTLTGPRVVWAVGARFETEAEAGFDSPVAQFVREIGDEFLVRMSPARFDDAMIRAYLETRPGAHTYADEQIDKIARFTRGLPLAVSFTATLLDGGQSVAQVCQEMDDGLPSSIVSLLARRYLVHAEQQTYPAHDPRRDDVTKILGLALAFGDLRGDPDLLATLWNTEDPLTAFQDLARRHDFVLPVSRRLHDDVRDTLRTDLLDPYRRTRARQISQRAADLFSTRLGQMRSRWPSLDEQLDHTGFTAALLATLWHTLWADNRAGLDLFIQILPVLAVADPPAADAAAALTEQFAGTFEPDQRRDLELVTSASPAWLVHEQTSRRQGATARPARRVKLTLPGLALHPPPGQPGEPLIGNLGDREVAVQILRAGLQSDEAAVATLRTAAAQTTSTRLRQSIGSQAEAIASRLIWAGQQGRSVRTVTGMAAAKLATETVTEDASVWQTYATALDDTGRFEDALAACEQALALDSRGAAIYNSHAIVLQHLGQLEDALAACDQALALNSGFAAAHGTRGNVLGDLGRFEDALAAYDQVLAANPGYAISVHNNRGVTLQSLGRFEDALAAFDQALSADPSNGSAHANKGIFLAVRGDLDRALAELDTAKRLKPDGWGEAMAWAGAILWHRRDPAAARDRFAHVKNHLAGSTPFHTAELEAIALCGLDRPEDAERHLRSALSLRAPGDGAEPRAIYNLLSSPPLMGIDQLRAIIEPA